MPADRRNSNASFEAEIDLPKLLKLKDLTKFRRVFWLIKTQKSAISKCYVKKFCLKALQHNGVEWVIKMDASSI